MIATGDAFETSYSLAVAPALAWSRMALSADERRAPAADSVVGARVFLPGWEMTGEILESVRGRRLRLRKDRQPCKDTVILIELEAAGDGVSVRLVQSGFAGAAASAADVLGIGADFIFRDFALYLETGVMAHRHMSAWAVSLGADVRETPSGLQVTRVAENGLASRAGLAPGDRLLTLAGASVVTQRDLVIALRTQQGQERVRLYWTRESEEMSGYGTFQ